MHFYRVILLLVMLMQTFLTVEGGFTIYNAKPRDCEYRGYVPGGNVDSVGKIKATTAKMAGSGVAQVMGPVSKATMLTMHGVNLVKAVVSAFKTVAPALGPCLGVFGAATGIFTAMTSPKPGDILEAANAAIGDLTRDVNEKMEKMQGYVDSQIIRVQKNLISRSYDSDWIYWRNCVKEPSFEKAQECQTEAYALLVAERPQFAIYADKIKAKELHEFSTTLPGIEVRELEAYLVPFRNYANMILMMLKPLVETFGKDDSSIGEKSFDRYKSDMEEEAKYYIWYAKAAVTAIVRYHNGPHYTGHCMPSLTCGRMNVIKEGWGIPVHTNDRAQCECVIDEGTKQTCKLEVQIRADGEHPDSALTYNYDCSSLDCAASEFAGRTMYPDAQKYKNKDVEIVKAYWQKELLDFVPVWEKAIAYATNATYEGKAARADVPSSDDEQSGDGESSDDVTKSFKFSPEAEERMKKARKEAKELMDKIEALKKGETLTKKLKDEVKERQKKAD